MMSRRRIVWIGITLGTLLASQGALAEQEAEEEEAEADEGGEPARPAPAPEAEAEAPAAPPPLTPEEQARRATVLAVVNGTELTIGEFEDRLNKQGPFRRVQYGTPEKRREFLDEMIEWELEAQEARRRKLHEDESVRQQVKRVMSSLLLRREVDDRVRPEDVTTEEMQAYYEEHITTFKRPERVRAYHIVMADRAKAQSLLSRILDEETDTREFRRLAREMSEDAVTKRRGGDLRYFTRPEERGEGDPEVSPAIVKATFDLLAQRRLAQKRASKAGGAEPSPGGELPGFNPVYPKLVQTPEGFHILRFMGHREAVNRTFEDVERQIRNRIWREKLQTARETFITDLRERHRVEVSDENLGLVKVDLSPMGPERPSAIKSKIQPRPMPGPPMKRPGDPMAEPVEEEVEETE
jgi:peptidyl-prolyl cis-trans isomerase C